MIITGNLRRKLQPNTITVIGEHIGELDTYGRNTDEYMEQYLRTLHTIANHLYGVYFSRYSGDAERAAEQLLNDNGHPLILADPYQ